MSNKQSDIYPIWVGHALGGLQRSHRVIGIGTLIITQILDIVVTVYGLTLPGVIELNPIAVSAMDSFGTIWGLLILSVVAIVMVTLVTEFAAVHYATPDFPALYVRMLGYLPLVAVSTVSTSYNITLLIQI